MKWNRKVYTCIYQYLEYYFIQNGVISIQNVHYAVYTVYTNFLYLRCEFSFFAYYFVKYISNRTCSVCLFLYS